MRNPNSTLQSEMSVTDAQSRSTFQPTERKSLGFISTQVTEKGRITVLTGPHIFTFSIRPGDLDISLLTVGGDVNMTLYGGGSRRGVSVRDIITESQPTPEGNQSISLAGLGGGSYQLRIESNIRFGEIDYTLEINTKSGGVQFEREPNQSLSEAHQLDENGSVNLNGTRIVRGLLDSRQDGKDIWRFQVNGSNSFFARLHNFKSPVKMTLLDASGSVIFPASRRGVEFINIDRLLKGTYYVQVIKSGMGETSYDLSLTATPVNRAQLDVTIRRIKAIDDFEGWGRGQADFYARVTIEGKTKTSRTIDNKDDVSPFFRFSERVGISKPRVPFSISIRESDRGSDEHADINPYRGQKDLPLEYNPTTRTVTGPGVVSQEGDLIMVEGKGDSHKALVVFQVNYFTSRSD